MGRGKNKENNFSAYIGFNILLVIFLALALLIQFFKIFPLHQGIFIALSFLGLFPVLQNAFLALIKRHLTIDLLASIALIFSFIAQQWYSAAFINLMLASARIFDLWTELRAKHIIEHLMKYRPAIVKIRKGEEIIDVPIEQVKIGDEVVIEAGERIPVDGAVISGQASVNESTLTGESIPITKKIGDSVLTSTLNESGSLLVRTEKIGKDSTLSKMVALIEEASRNKAHTEQIAAKFTEWYILLTLAGSIILYAITGDSLIVLSVLLVVCADDIAVAVPLTYTAGIARAAQLGIIIKGSDILETLPKVNVFMTDKTGTITNGKPKIKEVENLSNLDQNKLLEILGTATVNSNHPVSIAVINYLKNKNIKIESPDEFIETPGDGISIKKNNSRIFVGKVEFLEQNKIIFSEADSEKVEDFQDKGMSITAIGMDDKLIGLVIFEDEIKSFASELIRETKQLGIKKWIMLTGDNEKVTGRVVKETGIDQFKSGLKPEEKLKYIENFQKDKNNVLAMMGDGVNDAAALALADVSIAMGAIGSDAAIEAADIALMKDDLKRIPDIILLGEKVHQIVKQNFWIWGITNALGLGLVSVGLIGPIGAATFNFITDFFPILNALRAGAFIPKHAYKTKIISSDSNLGLISK